MNNTLRRDLPSPAGGGAPEIGTLVRISDDGTPFVEYRGSRGEKIARCANAAVGAAPPVERLVGAAVLIVFEANDRNLPVIIGFVRDTLWAKVGEDGPAVVSTASALLAPKLEGTNVVIEGKEAVVLRCGLGSISLMADGHIVIKGLRVTSRARETNKVRGAVVLIN